MTANIPQSNIDPLLRQWQATPQGGPPLPENLKAGTPSETREAPVVPAPEPLVVEVPVSVAPQFKVTGHTVTILHGGSQYIYKGHQSTYRIHTDANGVEHIYYNKVMQSLPNLNVHVVRREIVKG